MTDKDLMQQALEALEAALSHDQPYIDRCKQVTVALRERLAREDALDKMAENARELGLTYEPLMEDLRIQQSEWDNIPKAFNDWWNQDYDDSANPFRLNSSAYWAWAGWQAARQEQCPCGDRAASQCPGQWEPGCDLGSNPKYAKPARQEQEPVAWMDGQGRIHHHPALFPRGVTVQPLYTAPQQPLTDEQINALDYSGTRIEFVRAIEAAHGITGEKK